MINYIGLINFTCQVRSEKVLRKRTRFKKANALKIETRLSDGGVLWMFLW